MTWEFAWNSQSKNPELGITWESICQDWELVRILLQEKVQIPKIGNNKETPNVKPNIGYYMKSSVPILGI